MYKAIFVDIDGTLVDEEKNVSNRTKIAIEKAKKLGIETIICTGRQCDSAKIFKDNAGASKYIICTNGTQIYDLEKSEILFKSCIEKNDIQNLYKIAIDNDIILKLDIDNFRVVSKNIYNDPYVMELDNLDDITEKYQVSQISFSSLEPKKLDFIKDYIKNSKYTKIINEFTWPYKNNDLITLNCIDCNTSKGNAMVGLCKFLKIDLKDVIAIGDQKNDISMIKMAGMGVAMGNSEEIVKKSADMVTDTNENDGVAKVIEKIIKDI